MEEMLKYLQKDYPQAKLYHGHMHPQILVPFPNGYTASIIGGSKTAYGDGIVTFELAVVVGNHCVYDTPITDDVLAYQTADQILLAVQRVKELEIR